MKIFIVLLIFLFSCKEQSKKIIILSKASESYINWISDENTIIIDAYKIKNTDSLLNLADGIILTGGEDINPIEYNDTSNIKLCGPINYKRDTLERKLFEYAFKNKIPLIGVCRGMQMMNVVSGGTLYGDIPSEIGNEVIHRFNGVVNHEIVLCDTSSLIFSSNRDTIVVNSFHHQALKKIPPFLRVIARALDGIPEAVVMVKKHHPYLFGVQFHPERLGKENQIYQTIRSSFHKQLHK